MAFSDRERALLLAVKGVGPTVVRRLEEMGVEDLADLATREAAELCAVASAMLGSTCWRNSPQARAAVAAAIAAAKAGF
ncbi:helix-hairpin-helix domain-containing protein [Phenylobacterium sp.]|uniref:helix-hairpin-helix domain-containing protein n=1 Tax=Phenylobacterium sp. TaxID=1871053 RepID=UPI0035B174F2